MGKQTSADVAISPDVYPANKQIFVPGFWRRLSLDYQTLLSTPVNNIIN